MTDAQESLTEDVRGRQRRYVISMTVRTLAVIAAAGLWDRQRYIAVVALALAVLMPYAAVVIANGGRRKSPAGPRTSPSPSDPAGAVFSYPTEVCAPEGEQTS
nr:DUF3099 domain-containing protein [Streptomyces montanus]